MPPGRIEGDLKKLLLKIWHLTRYGDIYNYISFVRHIPEPDQENYSEQFQIIEIRSNFVRNGNLEKAYL